jgi:hypothetical protein
MQQVGYKEIKRNASNKKVVNLSTITKYFCGKKGY